MEEIVFKVIGIALLGAFGALLLRSVHSEAATLLRIGGLLVLFGMVLVQFGRLAEQTERLLHVEAVAEYAAIMLRALGIGFLCKLSADVCRDAGEGGLAGGIELGGKVAILMTCIPVLGEIVEYAIALMSSEG